MDAEREISEYINPLFQQCYTGEERQREETQDK